MLCVRLTPFSTAYFRSVFYFSWGGQSTWLKGFFGFLLASFKKPACHMKDSHGTFASLILVTTWRDINWVFFYWRKSIQSRSIPVNGGGRIYPTLTAITPTPTLHLARFKVSSFSKPTLLLSFFTCVFHVFFGRPCFLFPFTSNSNTFLKTCPSSLLNTCPYHLTPFTFALDYGILSQVISGSCLKGVLKNTYRIIFSQLLRVKITILMSPNLYRLSQNWNRQFRNPPCANSFKIQIQIYTYYYHVSFLFLSLYHIVYKIISAV